MGTNLTVVIVEVSPGLQSLSFAFLAINLSLKCNLIFGIVFLTISLSYYLHSSDDIVHGCGGLGGDANTIS